MKVQVKISPAVIVEAQGETIQHVFEEVARLAEVFGRSECGACGFKHVLPTFREVDSFKYFQLKCQNAECGAEFRFGQPKNVKGGLFPQLKDKEGNWKPNSGWVIWEGRRDQGDGGRRPGDEY